MGARRSRIELGPAGIAYLAIGGVLVAATLYTQANLLFWALGLMVGGLIVSAGYAAQVLRHVDVRRVEPARGVVGEPLVLRYQVTNATWLPAFSVVVMETWGRRTRAWRREGPVAERPPRLSDRPRGWLLHVGPRQRIQAQTLCHPRRRGWLELERIVVECSFPFGILRKRVAIEQPARTLIYPTIHRLERPLVTHVATRFDAASQRQRDRGGGDGEFFGLRGYRAGDPLRLIDWKRTARLGTLVSRELTQPTPPRLMLLLDLTSPPSPPPPPRHPGSGDADNEGGGEGRGGGDAEAVERAISLAASVICETRFHSRRVGLAVHGAPAPSFSPRQSQAHRGRMLEALARLEIEQDHTDHEGERAGLAGAGAGAGAGVEPNVVVCRCAARAAAYRQGRVRGRGRAVVLAADELERHVEAFARGIDDATGG